MVSKQQFALVDCNNFYASCERAFNPSLQQQPIVILSNNDGCIVSRSNEAKALGIPMGGAVHKAQHIIDKHKIKVFSSNYTLYGDMSKRVMGILKEHCPATEVYSIDEAFLNLSHDMKYQYPDSIINAQKLADIVKQSTGIPVSIGLGPNKTLSKIANHVVKTKLSAHSSYDLTPLPERETVLETILVEDIWGVGRGLTKQLYKLGIRTGKQLRDMEIRFIRKYFNVVMERTVRELRGESCIELDRQNNARKQIISSRSFGYKVTRFQDMREAVSTYSARAAVKLRMQKSVANFITVYIRTSSFHQHNYYSNSYSMPVMPPSDDTAVLSKLAVKALSKVFRAGCRYHKAGIVLSGLQPRTLLQNDLFQTEHQQKHSDILDKINNKLGSNTLQLAGSGLKKAWQARCTYSSPHYTTNWQQLAIAYAY